MLNQLRDWLKGLDNKTGLFAAILLIVGVLAGVKDAEGQTTISVHAGLIIDAVAGILLIGFKAFAPTGNLTKGETLTFYVSQSLLVLMQVGQLVTTNDGGLFNEHFVSIVAQAQFWLTAAFAALQSTRNGGGTGLATR